MIKNADFSIAVNVAVTDVPAPFFLWVIALKQRTFSPCGR